MLFSHSFYVDESEWLGRCVKTTVKLDFSCMDSWDFLKPDLLLIPEVPISENWDFVSVESNLFLSKKKFVFRLNLGVNTFSAV